MDKELPKSHFELKPGKVFVKLSEHTMPNGEPFFRGSIAFRHTLTVEDLVERIVKRGSHSRSETLIANYRTMVEEMYRAFEDGFNVDFDLGRTELTVNGRFNGAHDKFDKKRHSLNVCLRPSARLNQIADYVPAQTDHFYANIPHITEVNTLDKPSGRDAVMPFNTVPAGSDRPIFIHGMRLKLMGDLPDVGVTLRNLESGESYSIASHRVIINTGTMLCIHHRIPLTPGEWEVEVATQYNRSYRLYKQVRCGSRTFTVCDSAASGCGE